MKKIRKVYDRAASWIGEKLFPHADEQTRKRLAAMVLVGLVCLVLVSIFRYRAMQQIMQYQRIADMLYLGQ
ncbi:MAG: hypothetical protein NC548_55905 [Lachnospiraceae bacterium]|nr:hypothetical protein [Lachnospiraceae bacterium]